VSDIPLPPNVYHPRHALMNALREWLPEFNRQKTVWGPMSKPQVGLTQPVGLINIQEGSLIPGVNTCKKNDC
jgi:protein O-GlcNAcase/histone acetyltransferase